MKPLRTRLQEARKHLSLPWEVMERDYLLSWVLAGISQVQLLRDTLAFKGGTALKKCYFGEYRFSEDLDFTGLEGIPTGNALEQAIHIACEMTAEAMNEYAPVEVFGRRYVEKQPHPKGQEAFTVHARYPWQRGPRTRVMIEITVDEKVLIPPLKKSVIHEYEESLSAEVYVYTLEEIVAEKLRAILQYKKRLEQRGWNRSRARDFYDLWQILRTYRDRMDLSGFAGFLHEKCAVRDVTFENPDDFFQETVLIPVRETWDQWLGPLVPKLPPFATVIQELRPLVIDLLRRN